MIQFNVNGAGFKGASVTAKSDTWPIFAGVWYDGKLYGPDMAAIRALIPHRWRAAFDRAGGMWWPKSACLPARGFDIADNEKPQGYMALHDRRGRYLTTIYANGEIAE